MSATYYHYPKCGTCKKAKKWLDEQSLEVVAKDITVETPSAEELKTWIGRSGLPTKRFFNTSGKSYRGGDFKDRLAADPNGDWVYEALAADGKLIKRPLLVDEKGVLVGFKEPEWKEHFDAA